MHATAPALTPDAFLRAAGDRLAGSGYAVQSTALQGFPAVIGRRKDFRLRFALTQLKTTVVVCAVDTVTYAGWEGFLADATGVARAFKGGLPNGLQSGFGAVPVLAGAHVEPAAAQVAGGPPRVEWFSGITLPALADLTHRQVYGFDGNQFVGRVYLPFLRLQRALITSIVRTA